jgi:hypothetical protein
MKREIKLERIIKKFVIATQKGKLQKGEWFKDVYNDAIITLNLPDVINCPICGHKVDPYTHDNRYKYFCFHCDWNK